MCGEPLAGTPERCFRCETPLGDWWRFEGALARLPAGPVPTASLRSPYVRGALAGGFATAVGLMAVMAVRAPARESPPAPAASAVAAPVAVAVAPTAPPSAAPPSLIRYHVQRGDSLSRIAARLTGDGRRWRELWPERADAGARLRAGEVLAVPVGNEASASRK